ncbi:hypothetical protein ACSBR1_015346 [Camellia fascicularis]
MPLFTNFEAPPPPPSAPARQRDSPIHRFKSHRFTDFRSVCTATATATAISILSRSLSQRFIFDFISERFLSLSLSLSLDFEAPPPPPSAPARVPLSFSLTFSAQQIPTNSLQQEKLVDASTLKKEVAEGVHLMVVRELTGGIYFGKPRGFGTNENGDEIGFNTEVYATYKIDRIAHVAFETARKRGRKLCSVDKANVLEASMLWRQRVMGISWSTLMLNSPTCMLTMLQCSLFVIQNSDCRYSEFTMQSWIQFGAVL